MEQVNEYTWTIPQSYRPEMRVPCVVYANKQLLQKMGGDQTLQQCVNVSTLPGIQRHAITLPDGHEGYGFPIGGVAAFDHEEGVISPGGVGYDINCGARLLRTNLTVQDIKGRLSQLIESFFRLIPSGLGSRGKLRLSASDLDKVLVNGVSWAIEQGYGWPEDREHCEEEGCMPETNLQKISQTAKSRGAGQLGTLGSGNHFLEIGAVDKIYDSDVSKTIGINQPGQITVLIHTGSRGYGHQVCSDYLRIMEQLGQRHKIALPDRELACAPLSYKEAEDYYQAMSTACNFAWTNRQIITHWVRQAFRETFQTDPENLDLHLVYDVAHNIAKKEEHTIEGRSVPVVVHRKGATRAFPPNHPSIPADYKSIGQPVLIPGSMGTSSWILVGTPRAMDLSFGSTAHGAGRLMSRNEAKRQYRGGDVLKQLGEQGIIVRAADPKVVAEEAPGAYKDVDMVAEVSHQAGIATKVARLVPLGVTKG